MTIFGPIWATTSAASAGRQRRLAADRHEQDVDRAELAELLVGQQVAEVAEMADVDAVDLEAKTMFSPREPSRLAVVVGADRR